jgi:hypothetical protein
MPTFRKFAFPSQKVADQLLASLQPLDFAVPLGHLCAATDAEGNCIKTRPEFAVDILFHDTCPEELAAFVVWPTPCGVHCFSGWDEQYAADYQEFATPQSK